LVCVSGLPSGKRKAFLSGLKPAEERSVLQRIDETELFGGTGLLAGVIGCRNPAYITQRAVSQLEQGSGPTRDPELYFFTFFGEPSEREAWGWRYEGHHCSQNWTMVDGKSISGLANSPQFFGANPGVVVQADQLVRELMLKRGYPMGDFERRAADISVDHPAMVENYRAAQAIAARDERGEPDTEELRKAVVHYRVLFDEMLEIRVR
jgi:hypothetical protein